jgi:hypothetical protein
MKKAFIIIDTETTQGGKVVDFGAVVCDKGGNVLASCAVLVREFFNDPETHPLFYAQNFMGGKANLPKRYANYKAKLDNGQRMLASVPAINLWLAKANATFRPVLTAYNLKFDQGVMTETGIDHTIFQKRFCLWHAAAAKWGHTKAYRQMVLDTAAFNNKTEKGNWSYQTKAEPMTRFVLGDATFPNEPHTAYEDALEYELPILVALVKNTLPKDYMSASPYSWQNYQVRDHFKPA